MTNTGMFFRMLLSAVFRRRSRAVMAVVASLVGAATLSCLAMICIAVPQQMNQEMRAYGANLIVTPLADSENGKSGIDDAMVEHTTQMVSAKGSEKHATYRYENVRVNAAPYVMAGVNPAQVRNLNHHWVVDGSWPSAGKVLVGRDVADAMGLKVGGSITIGYRASDNAASSGQVSQPGTDGTDGTAQSGTGGTTQSGDESAQSSSTGASRPRTATSPATSWTRPAPSSVWPASLTPAAARIRSSSAGRRRGQAHRLHARRGRHRILVGRLGPHRAGQQHQRYDVDACQGAAGHQDHRFRHARHHDAADAVLDRVAGCAGVHAGRVGTTISSIVSQRRNEIGLRKALGASSHAIGVEFYVESAVYGLLGGLLGTATGYGMARWLCATVFERSIGFNWWLAVVSVVFSALVAVVASIPPVHRATRIDPAVVLREE